MSRFRTFMTLVANIFAPSFRAATASEANMNSDRLCAMIRRGGSARERANQILQTRFFYLVRQVGVRKLRLSYEEAAMVYADALTELDQKIYAGEVIEDVGKMLYTLTSRRGVDAVRRRTTKVKIEPLSQPSRVLDLPQWLFDTLQHSEENMEGLFQHEDETEPQQRQQAILACLKWVLEGMPPKRRALLVDKLDGYDYEELTQLHGFKNERVAHEMVSRGMESLRNALREACQQRQPVCRKLCAWMHRKGL